MIYLNNIHYSCVQKYRGLTVVVVLRLIVNEIRNAFSIRYYRFGHDLSKTTGQPSTVFDYDIFETFFATFNANFNRPERRRRPVLYLFYCIRPNTIM